TDIILDPGFGFAKTPSQNFILLKQLKLLSIPDLPVMVGLSRKATIYKTLDIKPEDSLNGTTVMHTLALQGGAQILRVHDVKEAVEAIRLWTSYASA
ncbi:MAG TPA: dihydropteroate synthase, partial [Puia sp.]|nr:dihydropteroate synthase [Puia sp.]